MRFLSYIAHTHTPYTVLQKYLFVPRSPKKTQKRPSEAYSYREDPRGPKKSHKVPPRKEP